MPCLLRQRGGTLSSGCGSKPLALFPRTISLGGRDASTSLELSAEAMLTRLQSGCPNILDFDTGECRPASEKDVELFTRLVDGLEHVAFLSSPDNLGNSLATETAQSVRCIGAGEDLGAMVFMIGSRGLSLGFRRWQ